MELGKYTVYELFGVFFILIICICFFFKDGKKWLFPRRTSNYDKRIAIFEGYTKDRPESWKTKFTEAKGKNQSPVNIKTSSCLVVSAESNKHLIFNHQYFILPKSMTVYNDGLGVLVGACFDNNSPQISGGPLKTQYRFNFAQFRWGPTDDEGSEHTINSKRFAMELQLLHIKGDKVYENLSCAVRSRAVLFISYFFEVTPVDNPYLVPIIQALHYIQCPNQVSIIEPFPLCWLFHPFKSKYYYYHGSITYPPCTEGADWIIQSEPLSISAAQLRNFRALNAKDGMMLRNTRPVQKVNDRKVYFYE